MCDSSGRNKVERIPYCSTLSLAWKHGIATASHVASPRLPAMFIVILVRQQIVVKLKLLESNQMCNFFSKMVRGKPN